MIQYTCDSLGRVLTQTYEDGDTVSYAYGNSTWGDLLTSYNGKTFSYDTIGNLLSDGTWTYTWEHGRQLASMTSGLTTWTYTYDANGMRTQRTTGASTYTYVYNGSQLSKMTYGSNALYFTYDASGAPATVTYNGVTYFYVTNLQGDVVAILNSSGVQVVGYTYDAWGRLLTTTGTLASTLGLHNPLRYRGYVYDRETGLYYLQSRYYNPTIGRFINADAFASTGQGMLSNNMFAYCGNNPVNRIDPEGKSWIAVLIVVAVSALLLSGCSSDVGAATPYTPSDSTEFNCYAYALGEEQWKYVGGSPGAVEDYDVHNVANMVLDDAQKDGRTMRIIDSYDSPIEYNEYRIALRTGEGDYHFMVQHSDGSWSHKPGFCSTRLIDGANPSVVSWDAPKVDSYLLYCFGIVREIGVIENYYDSETIYFAVSK